MITHVHFTELMNSELQSIVENIPDWTDAKNLVIEQIAGLTNTNYCVTVDGEKFVLRVCGKNTEHLGINREHELEALRAAAAAGIGPEVVYFKKPEGHLVTRWVPGRHWTYEEYRRPDRIKLIVETTKQLHGLAPIEGEFSLFARVKSLIRAAQEFRMRLPEDLGDFLDTMQFIEDDQQRDKSDWFRFCHNDLVSCNYLYFEEEKKITIIDWEFAGMGDLYFDLATLVYTHDNIGPIPPELEDYLLACYFGEAEDESRIRLAGMKFMLMLFSAVWGISQHRMQKAG
ncbi:MAG: choline/ethanolamine kinase family protein, partial [Candidatus Thorarchaeota archaeon]